jgi:putative ABC transport system permease protein
MQTTIEDLTYAVRSILKARGFAAVAILTIALGIGANTAMFTVVNAVLLRPLPYAHPGRLVMVWQDLRARGGPADEWATPGNYADWRRETGIFQQIAVMTGWRPTLTGGPEPEPLTGEQVSHEYFPVLGISPIAGRAFIQDDDVPNARRVVVIGHGLWKRRFGGDVSAVGRTVTLNGEPHEIVGVLPDGFRPIVSGAAEIWRPLRINTAAPSRGTVVLRAIARLPDDVPLERAQAAASALAKRLEAAHPQFNEKTGFNLTPLHDRVVGDIKPGLIAVFGAVAFVLLIACANIANLLLARGSSRGREIAVRMALGATRRRVIRQLLTESVLLAVIGGAVGLVFGIWAVSALVSLAPSSAPRVDEVGLDATVFAFAALLTLATGVAFGLVPALQSSRTDVSHALNDAARGGSGMAGRAIRRTLVIAEIALALMLLTGGALLLETFVRLESADLGFNPENVLVGFVNPPRVSYDTGPKYRALYDQLLERASALPGVQKAALASVLPLSGDSDTSFTIEGRPAPSSQSETPVTWYRQVSAGYFDAMGMTMRRGRMFAEGEPAPSVIVNETFVRTFFPREEPLGRRVRFGGQAGDPWFTIIGVVADAKARGAREAAKVETFIPYWQLLEPGIVVILKSANPGQLTAPLRAAVSSLDRDLPVSGITTLSEMVGDSIAQPRFVATLAVAFAGLALVLAAIGLYGVMAYAVSQRTTEIGVRMALGATPWNVFRLVVEDGLRLAALGIALGITGSLIMAQWLAALLFGVQPGDPTTLVSTAAVLLFVSAFASVVPARRATRVDPMVAIRSL